MKIKCFDISKTYLKKYVAIFIAPKGILKKNRLIWTETRTFDMSRKHHI